MPILTGDRRSEGLEAARAWRIANKPRFDAIYGPETKCPTCHGSGRIATMKGTA